MIANPNDGNSPRVEAATPIIDVSAEGLITATTEQEAGYVPGGTKSSTKQLPTQAAKTVTPGTTNQTAVASGRYTTGAVQVQGDSNLKAENIVQGKSIFGVSGTAQVKTAATGTITRKSYYSFYLYYITGTSYGTITYEDAPIEISSYTNTFIMVSVSNPIGGSPSTTGLERVDTISTNTGFIFLYRITSATFSLAV